MKSYPTNQIRNLACIGHGHAGKTQLVSSILHLTGATQRWGKVDEGTTVTDYDEDSIARKITLNTQLAPCGGPRHKNKLLKPPRSSSPPPPRGEITTPKNPPPPPRPAPGGGKKKKTTLLPPPAFPPSPPPAVREL